MTHDHFLEGSLTMSDYDFDLFVIGAGSGGVRAARMAASYGKKVGIAEEYRLGGTCVIRGCVPKKLFVYASRYAAHFEDAAGFGWDAGTPKFDWKTLLANKNKEIDRLNGIYGRLLEGSGVSVYESRAELEDAHTIRLANGETFSAETILVATGSFPYIPDFRGKEHVITSNELLELEELPESMVIVGGGYIALEFAGIFNGLGVDVTVVYRGPQILRGFDQDLRDGLSEEMTKRGIKILCQTQITTIAEQKQGYNLTLDTGETLQAEKVAYATGRRALTQGLGLEKLGMELGWDGHIVVDEYSRSSIDNIYAVGDVTQHDWNLTPVAIDEAMALTNTLYNNTPTEVDHSYIASAVFSEPEIGTIGLSEEEARERYKTVDIYKSRFKPMVHSLSARDEKMLMKLVVCGESGKVLGCHIMGADAAEIVQMAAISMRMGATKADFDKTMALHPSAAEELVTMRTKWTSEG